MRHLARCLRHRAMGGRLEVVPAGPPCDTGLCTKRSAGVMGAAPHPYYQCVRKQMAVGTVNKRRPPIAGIRLKAKQAA